MAWYCKHCKTRMGGNRCGNRWRDENGRKVRCQDLFMTEGEQFPRLDGMVFINDDGTGIPRWEQKRYDDLICKRGQYPKSVQGPRPQGWHQALETIGERAKALIVGGLPEC